MSRQKQTVPKPKPNELPTDDFAPGLIRAQVMPKTWRRTDGGPDVRIWKTIVAGNFLKTVKKFRLRYQQYMQLMDLEDWSLMDIRNFVKDTVIFAVAHFGYTKFIRAEMAKYGLSRIEIDVFVTNTRPYEEAHKLFRDAIAVAEPAGKEPRFFRPGVADLTVPDKQLEMPAGPSTATTAAPTLMTSALVTVGPSTAKTAAPISVTAGGAPVPVTAAGAPTPAERRHRRQVPRNPA